MTGPVRAVIFDLDGTLVQTRVASWEVFEPISRRHGLGVETPAQYFELFRGNVFTSIRGLCSDDEQAWAATADFLAALRAYYAPPLVPGMHAVVRRLASVCTLAVMSSNAMEVLRRVLVENELAYCFAHVFGGDVAPDKRAALRAFLADAGSGYGRRCSADYDEASEAERPDPSTTVLVTDTAGDVRDAREVGVRVVGVTWGMHSADELAEAGAEFVALWPQEVLSHLLGDDAARGPTGACAVPGAAVSAPSAGAAGCGCGCTGAASRRSGTTGEEPGERRRRRRREAVATALPPAIAVESPAGQDHTDGNHTNGRHPVASDDVLEAMRRICRG
ncbi:HAD family hydrolase [Actinomycetospora cinnamomea]|uniref:Phosphoglycolate phosphatase n=1 Tax=Actinomycetospora cinnamomea TaxID=663609 RepID=A0A2U1FF94_9PSEU|nr:HAD hydrolase-like protein [Actinomycetospora cinnamomea]PVZ10854.1 phosphoglycolate phosphatase [Actinomycetospora cinnamomea]